MEVPGVSIRKRFVAIDENTVRVLVWNPWKTNELVFRVTVDREVVVNVVNDDVLSGIATVTFDTPIALPKNAPWRELTLTVPVERNIDESPWIK
jgi:predicted nuclease with RNAse H fold